MDSIGRANVRDFIACGHCRFDFGCGFILADNAKRGRFRDLDFCTLSGEGRVNRSIIACTARKTQDGLVEYTSGFMVTPISVSDIQEIFEARIFFETELFRLAVKKISDEVIEELEKQSRADRDAKSPDYAETFLESNHKFHTALAATGGNHRLLWYYDTLMNEAQRLFYIDISLHYKDFGWAMGTKGLSKHCEVATTKPV
jgi:hypothetical protein